MQEFDEDELEAELDALGEELELEEQHFGLCSDLLLQEMKQNDSETQL